MIKNNSSTRSYKTFGNLREALRKKKEDKEEKKNLEENNSEEKIEAKTEGRVEVRTPKKLEEKETGLYEGLADLRAVHVRIENYLRTALGGDTAKIEKLGFHGQDGYEVVLDLSALEFANFDKELIEEKVLEAVKTEDPDVKDIESEVQTSRNFVTLIITK